MEKLIEKLWIFISGIPYVNRWLIYIFDILISLLASIFAFSLVKELFKITIFSTPEKIFCFSVLFSAVSFLIFKINQGIIRHSSLQSLWRIILACLCKSLFFVVSLSLTSPNASLESVLIYSVLDFFICIFLFVLTRISIISVYQIAQKSKSNSKYNILIYISSYQKGGTVSKDVQLDFPSLAALLNLNISASYQIVGFLSKAYENYTYRMGNFPIYGVKDDLAITKLMLKENVSGLLFISDTDLIKERNNIVSYALKKGIKLFTLPPMDSWNRLGKMKAKEVSIEDLLGREEISISEELLKEELCTKIVLVTGAAGSIGSELCRQLAKLGVKQLVMYDINETGIHNIRLDLEENFPNLDFYPIVGDVRSKNRLNNVFDKYKIDIVFHAAAYKHVPLMETNPCEAILANVIGTKNVADVAVEHNCQKFVMVSTDKAVNPTNVMGASKRLAEIYVQSLDRAINSAQKEGKTRFITTRFGNVLGSQGSVIPRFRQQIEKGGPVTVTSPKITRYFMTIKEACLLVLEASVIGRGGEIMVFDMGEPVLIADLAKRMISLAGYTVGSDIEIVYTGLRPGEKLYEEVLNKKEETLPTTHKKIRIANTREYSYLEVNKNLDQLKALAKAVDVDSCIRLVKDIIPEYVSNNSEFERFDKKG